MVGGTPRLSEPIRRRGKVDFPRVLIRITVVIHLILILPFHEFFARIDIPYSWPLAVALALTLVTPIHGRIQAIVWDTPRAGWKLLLLDEPYFIHWCASLLAAPLLVLGCLIAGLFDLVQGRDFSLHGEVALAIYAVLLTLGVYAIKVRRRWVVRRHQEIFIDGLDSALDGYRITQLSDLHIGGMLPPGLGERWVRMANEEAPDLTVITGDLVTSGINFHNQIADLLGGLRAQDGVVVSMGNHDYFGEPDSLPEKLERAGLCVLRNASKIIERDGAKLRIAGVDDTWTSRADLERTLAGPKPAPTVLLAHDPNLFDRAAELGADLVLSGHTHAGQLAMPFLVERINLARIAYRYTFGLYYRERSTLYVHAGMGTTGPPARFGAAPELVTFTLRPSPPQL